MEAQAFALPVVATDVSGIPELVTHGKTGWLVQERDPQALAAAIRRMIEEPALRLRLCGGRREECARALFLRAGHRLRRARSSAPRGARREAA